MGEGREGPGSGACGNTALAEEADDACRILHVEDDADAAFLVRTLLRLQRTISIDAIDHTRTKAAALAQVTDHGPYDVVLLDLHLPDNDGLGMIDQIIAHSPMSAIVVVTADDDRDVGIGALRRGAAQFLAKSQIDETTLPREIQFAAARKAYEMRLRRLSLTDELTGLPNRRALLDYYRVSRDRVARHGGLIVVAYYDLDEFKPVNDLFGHLAGDGVLRTVAARLRRGVRDGDLVARLSGDEFVAVGFAADRTEADDFVARLRSLVGEVPVGIGKGTVTAAAGVVICDGSETIDEVLARADAAMYHRKLRAR